MVNAYNHGPVRLAEWENIGWEYPQDTDWHSDNEGKDHQNGCTPDVQLGGAAFPHGMSRVWTWYANAKTCTLSVWSDPYKPTH
jgi:hypothetical protein